VGNRTALPGGVITFLFSDIEKSTRMFQRLGDRYPALLDVHNSLLRRAFDAHGGVEVRTAGDSFFVAFPDAAAAISACAAAQQSLIDHQWPAGSAIRVRMGLHTANAQPAGDDYVALGVHQAARVSAVAHGGQTICSKATVDAIGMALPENCRLHLLGAFRLKDFDEPVEIFQLNHPALPSRFPPLVAPSASANNVPRRRTSFIGRQQEIADIRKLLLSDRLVTVHGPGGVGKTRLSIEVADESIELFPDGVWFIELAPIGDPQLVAGQVSSVLGVPAGPGKSPLDALLETLGNQRVLLVVDNCEHVVDAAAALIDELLNGCSSLTVLTTSREQLRVAGERVYRLDPLAPPAAVDLFVARASLADDDFELTSENAPAVDGVARRLDGIPLAIELAAARIGELDVAELLQSLDDRFSILDQGLRTALPRHQTLRAMVDWSYDRLAEPEQHLLRGLSVFRGGFTGDDAQSVCGRLSSGLVTLVDRSLITLDSDRYGMLETIREYGAERLVDAGERDAVWDQHATTFLAMAERVAPDMLTVRRADVFADVDREHDNFSAAFEWTIGRDRALAERLAAALWRYWKFMGHRDEGYRCLVRLRDTANAEVLLGLGRATGDLGDQAGAVGITEDALRIAETEGARRTAFDALLDLSEARFVGGSFGSSGEAAARALAVARELDDDALVGRAMTALADTAFYAGDFRLAMERLHDAVPVLRRAGDPQMLGRALWLLGRIARYQGDLAEARETSEEALAICEASGDLELVAGVLWNLGVTALLRGDLGEAGVRLNESLAEAERLRDRISIGFGLIPLGRLAEETGDDEWAGQLFDDALEAARNVQFAQLLAEALNSRGVFLARLRRANEARAMFNEALSVAEPIGEKRGQAEAHRGLGTIALDDGNPEEARARVTRALAIFEEIGDKIGATLSIETLAEVELAAAHPDEARRLLDQAASSRHELGFARSRAQVHRTSAVSRTP
jgi:predicted ATPase/class 3 adenylate cyclase/Tfp pilus assembly protein PilF